MRAYNKARFDERARGLPSETEQKNNHTKYGPLECARVGPNKHVEQRVRACASKRNSSTAARTRTRARGTKEP